MYFLSFTHFIVMWRTWQHVKHNSKDIVKMISIFWPLHHNGGLLWTKKTSQIIWDKWLGHPHSRIMQNIMNQWHLPMSLTPKNYICDPYCLYKSHKSPFLNSLKYSCKPIEIIHFDVLGMPCIYLTIVLYSMYSCQKT